MNKFNQVCLSNWQIKYWTFHEETSAYLTKSYCLSTQQQVSDLWEYKNIWIILWWSFARRLVVIYIFFVESCFIWPNCVVFLFAKNVIMEQCSYNNIMLRDFMYMLLFMLCVLCNYKKMLRWFDRNCWSFSRYCLFGFHA